MIEKKVEIANKKGEKLDCLLDIPRVDNSPIIVLNNSWGGDKEFTPIKEAAEFFLERDFAVLRFSYSGVGNSDGDEKKLTITSIAEDLQSVLEYVKQIKKVDNSKIGLVGHSLGTSAIVKAFSSEYPIKCIVMWSPVCDHKIVHYQHYLKKFRMDLEAKGYFTRHSYTADRDVYVGKELMEEFRNLELTPYFKNINVPTLMLYPSKNFPKYDQRHIMSYLEYISAPTDFRLINGNHDFEDSKSKKELFDNTLEWFEKYLKDA